MNSELRTTEFAPSAPTTYLAGKAMLMVSVVPAYLKAAVNSLYPVTNAGDTLHRGPYHAKEPHVELMPVEVYVAALVVPDEAGGQVDGLYREYRGSTSMLLGSVISYLERAFWASGANRPPQGFSKPPLALFLSISIALSPLGAAVQW